MQVIPGGNQMSLIRDTEEVIKFLEFAGRKSILNEHAINNRMTACHNLFSLLNEEEDNLKYILENLDVLVNRFRNKNTSVQASTLKVYKSRVKSSIEDFQDWSADPFAWERKVTDKARVSGLERRKDKRKKKTSAKARPSKKIEVGQKTDFIEDGVRTVSFPIRSDFSVDISLPEQGLTLAELQRLALFLFPYCKDLDLEKVNWPGMLQ